MNALAPRDRIIVALDVDSIEKAADLVEKLHPYVGCFKVGLEFITAISIQLIYELSEPRSISQLAKIRAFFAALNGNIFWDNKFDDIPNTVGGASRALTKMPVRMFNVHASAGIDAMMEAVANKRQSLVLAVTVLTSREENDANLTFGGSTKAKVLQFAREAKLAGCDGVVCSPQELELLGKREELRDLLKVTPGIRAGDARPDDQRRTMTATEAIMAGADYLVIGRPITDAAEPVAAAQKFIGEIAYGLKQKRP